MKYQSVTEAARLGLDDPDELAARVPGTAGSLFEARGSRSPGTDDKVLAAWNGMAIRALAEAGRAFAEPAYTRAAVAGADFILRELRDDEGQLRRSWRDGVRGGPAFADDHALMATACLTLYETTYETRWFLEARGLAENLIERFHDRERRVLPDGLGRGRPARAAEGALRQRHPQRELRGGRGPAATQLVERRPDL